MVVGIFGGFEIIYMKFGFKVFYFGVVFGIFVFYVVDIVGFIGFVYVVEFFYCFGRDFINMVVCWSLLFDCKIVKYWFFIRFVV